MVNRNIDNSEKKDNIEVNKLAKIGILVIKNLAIKNWYPWADEVNLHWSCAYFFFCYMKK